MQTMNAIETLNAFNAIYTRKLAEVKAATRTMADHARLLAKHTDARGVYESMSEEARHLAIDEWNASGNN